MAALEEKSAQLIEERLPGRHETGTNPVQRLDVELRLILELDEAHRRPRRRLGDGLSVAVVVLVRFDVGPHILGRHEPHRVALVRQQASQVVRAAAGFHGDDA